MRNTRTLTADWQILHHAASGGLAIGLLPHDESADALIIPVDAPLLHVLGHAMIDYTDSQGH
jgi:hypothetical protein